MDLKKGDILICKHYSKYVPLELYNSYEIILIFNVSDEYVRIVINYNNQYNDVFCTDKNDSMYIYKYFYTKQELRKLKLEKLKTYGRYKNIQSML